MKLKENYIRHIEEEWEIIFLNYLMRQHLKRKIFFGIASRVKTGLGYGLIVIGLM